MILNQTQINGIVFPLASDLDCQNHFCLAGGHAVCIGVYNWILAAHTALNSIALNGDTTSKNLAGTLLSSIPKVYS